MEGSLTQVENDFKLDFTAAAAMNNGGYTLKITIPQSIRTESQYVRLMFHQRLKLSNNSNNQVVIVEPTLALIKHTELPTPSDEFICSCLTVDGDCNLINVQLLTFDSNNGALYIKVKQEEETPKRKFKSKMDRRYSKRYIANKMILANDVGKDVKDQNGDNNDTDRKTVGHNKLNKLWKLYFGAKIYTNKIERGQEINESNKVHVGCTQWRELKWRENKTAFINNNELISNPTWYSKIIPITLPTSTTTDGTANYMDHIPKSKITVSNNPIKYVDSTDADETRDHDENDDSSNNKLINLSKAELQRDLLRFCTHASLLYYYDDLKNVCDTAFLCKRSNVIGELLGRIYPSIGEGFFTSMLKSSVRSSFALRSIAPATVNITIETQNEALCAQPKRRKLTSLNEKAIITGDFVGQVVPIYLIWRHIDYDNVIHEIKTETFYTETYKTRTCYIPLLENYIPPIFPSLHGTVIQVTVELLLDNDTENNLEVKNLSNICSTTFTYLVDSPTVNRDHNNNNNIDNLNNEILPNTDVIINDEVFSSSV